MQSHLANLFQSSLYTCILYQALHVRWNQIKIWKVMFSHIQQMIGNDGLTVSLWNVWCGIRNHLDEHWLDKVHYNDVIMGTIASQITSLTIVYSIIYSDADQRKHQSSASLAFVRGIHRGPVNSPHKGPVTRTMFPFDDVIMYKLRPGYLCYCSLLFNVVYHWIMV